MKKYQNVTKTTLAVDIYTRTIYVKSGEIVTLPMTRDVRYYSRINHLVVVKNRDGKAKLVKVAKFKRPKAKVPKKRGRKPKKVEEIKEEKLNETENN